MNRKHIEKDQLFDVKAAADFLGVNAGTIRRWAQGERLQGIKLGTRGDWRFTKEELLKMISNNFGVRQEWSWQKENTLIDSVTAGDAAILVVTKERRIKLEDGLRASGTAVDVAEILSRFMVNAMQDDDERLRTIAALQQKAMALQGEVTRRKKIERQKNEFMGVVSHELKTPVTSIKVFAELLERKLKQEGHSYAANVAKMRTQINKLNLLIDDMLDLTRLEEGKIGFREDFFLFDDLVEDVIEQVQATDANHVLVKQGSAKKQIFADRDRVGQVLTNLLTNAMKYSPNDENVIVTVSANSQEVICSVQDFGVGVSKEEQSYIFDRFYREAGESQATFPGLGLGLYISSQIVKRHGGRIWVKSERGEGSTFYFSLPARKRRRSK